MFQMGMARELGMTRERMLHGEPAPLGYLEWLVRKAWWRLRELGLGRLLRWAVRPDQRTGAMSSAEFTLWKAFSRAEEMRIKNQETIQEMRQEVED